MTHGTQSLDANNLNNTMTNTLEERWEKRTNPENSENTLLYTESGSGPCMYPESQYELDKDKVIAFIKQEISLAKKEVLQSIPCEEQFDCSTCGSRDIEAIQEWKTKQLKK